MNTALIKGVPVRYSVDELLETLPPQRVSRVHRRHRTPAVGRDESTPMNQIIVYFRDNAKRPAEMDFEILQIRVPDMLHMQWSTPVKGVPSKCRIKVRQLRWVASCQRPTLPYSVSSNQEGSPVCHRLQEDR